MEARKSNRINTETFLHWKGQLESAKSSHQRQTFVKRGDKIVEKYRDDNSDIGSNNYNILYSITDTILPVVFSDAPKADVRARDPKQIPLRKASEVVENALQYYIDNSKLKEKARLAVLDFLLAGQGVLRPRYIPLIEEEEISITDDEGNVDTEALEKILFEEIDFEYINWRDLLYPDVSSWADLPWLAFRCFMTYEEAEGLFGKDVASSLQYAERKQVENKDRKTGEETVEVYEVWDKHFKEQIFIAPSYNAQVPLQVNDDPLELEDFWPIAEPAFSLQTGGCITPVPFYITYQPQAEELNSINARIMAAMENLKRRGVYDSSIGELANIGNLGDNEFWPVQNFAELIGKGGLVGAMQVEDISQQIQVIESLYQKRQTILEDIFQITGISDIRRGATDPRETLGAQQMKGRYGTIRISTYQHKIADWLRDTISIAGEIIINSFEPETIATVTNMPLKTITSTNEDGSTKVVEVGVEDLLNEIRNKVPSDVVIDIETDTTVMDDANQEKKEVLDITAALTQFTQIAQPLIQTIGLEATANILTSIIHRFKLGRHVQQAVNDHIEQLKNAEANQEPAKPTKEELNFQVKMAELQLQDKKVTIDAALKQADLQIKQQSNFIRAEEIGMKNDIEQQKVDLDAIGKIIEKQALEAEAANPEDNAIVGA